MVVVNMSDFRANQGKFLDLAKSGEQVMLRSRLKGSFMLSYMDDSVAAAELVDDDYDHDVTPELLAQLEAARKEYREGKCVVCKTADEAIEYFDAL